MTDFSIIRVGEIDHLFDHGSWHYETVCGIRDPEEDHGLPSGNVCPECKKVVDGYSPEWLATCNITIPYSQYVNLMEKQ